MISAAHRCWILCVLLSLAASARTQDVAPRIEPPAVKSEPPVVKPEEPAPKAPDEAAAKAEAAVPKVDAAVPGADETGSRPAEPPGGRPLRKDATARESAAERIKILTQRNIFAKDRSARRPDASARRREEARPPTPEEQFRLTGLARQGAVAVAFLESSRDGKTLKKKSGEEIANGKVRSVGFDFIEYESAAGVTKVRIGSDLSGQIRSRPTSSPTTSSSPAPAGSSPAATPDGGTSPAPAPSGGAEESILERMRKKRLEELKK